jgi:DNA-binding SARP family transcriptional activator
MVLVFGVGFVFLGVGSGGLDLGSLVRDVFGSKGSSGTSISKARDEVARHPRDPKRYKKLADALASKGRTDEAISALERYMTLAPKDATQLGRLGQLQFTQAENFRTQAQIAYFDQQTSLAGSTLGVTPTGKLGQALGTDPIQQAVSGKVSTRAQQALTKYTTASTAAIKSFKRLAKLQPGVSSYFALARAAEQFSDNTTAVAAYKKLLKLESDPATKTQIKAKIKALQPAPTGH